MIRDLEFVEAVLAKGLQPGYDLSAPCECGATATTAARIDKAPFRPLCSLCRIKLVNRFYSRS